MPPRRTFLPASFVDVPAISRTAERVPPSHGEASAARAGEAVPAPSARRAPNGARKQRARKEPANMNAGLGAKAVPGH